MIKSMERRFTIVAVSAISLVLLLLILAVQLINSNINAKKADLVLNSIAIESGANIDLNQNAIFSKKTLINSIDFASLRSFSVTMDKSSESSITSYSGNKFVEEAVAITLANRAIEDRKTNGYVDNYRYFIVVETNVTRVFFLEYSNELEAANILLWVSLAVYLFSVVMVVIIVKLLMKPFMKPIKESYKKQKQFITDASHELKTPLTIIATDLQLVEMESGSTKWTKSISKQVKRLTMLSNDLVELTRMDEETSSFDYKELDLSALISDVVYGFEPALRVKGKMLEIAIEEMIKIVGNYDTIEKVIAILLENALKYSNKYGLVRVKLVRENKSTLLSVENTVDYIEKGNHNEYFERFYRADKSRNSDTGGFGIGLAMAKSIIEKHHWEIDANSPDNKRLIITVRFLD